MSPDFQPFPKMLAELRAEILSDAVASKALPATLTRKQYEAIQAENWSVLRNILRSPAHYAAAKLADDEDTAARRFGRCAHMATLEPARFASEVRVWTGGDRRGKDWTAFQEASGDREILKPDEHARCLAVAAAVRASDAGKYLEAGQAEQALTWDVDGVQCKGIPDFVSLDGVLIDLKTCGDASPEGFGRDALRMRYLAQLAFYVDGYRAANGVDLSAMLVAVETEAPFAVGVYRIRPEQLDLGRSEYRRALELLKRCRASGEWPGYGGEMDLQIPRWAAIGGGDLE